MKIEKILHRSYNGEVATVAEGILKTSDKNDWSSDNYLSGVLQRLITEQNKLSLAIKQDKATSALEYADENRDKPVSGLYNLVMGYRYHPDESISTAANTIHLVIDKYGLSNITEANYAQESALIESLLKDFEADNAKTAIALLPGVAELIATIRTAQDNFTSSFLTYTEEKANNNGKQSATKIKAAVLKLINNELVIYLRAMSIAAPDTYGNFAAATAQIIADNNDKVRRRITKKDTVDTE